MIIIIQENRFTWLLNVRSFQQVSKDKFILQTVFVFYLTTTHTKLLKFDFCSELVNEFSNKISFSFCEILLFDN